MPKYHGGHIWGEIRQALLHHRERLIAAFDAGSFEAESSLLDEIARKISEKVEPMVEIYADRPRQSSDVHQSLE